MGNCEKEVVSGMSVEDVKLKIIEISAEMGDESKQKKIQMLAEIIKQCKNEEEAKYIIRYLDAVKIINWYSRDSELV